MEHLAEIVGLLVWLIMKALVSEVHFNWIVISSLVIVAVAMLVGTSFLVNRRDGVSKKTGAMLQVGQMQLDGLPEEIEEPETDARLRRWAKAAFVVAVLGTVLLSLLSWRAAQQATRTAEWIAHTHEAITELESALRHSLDVETGGRGFVETGNFSFLDPYESGRRAVVQDLRALRLLLVTPDQLRRLNELEEQTNNLVQDAEAIVAARQNGVKVPTISLFEHGKHDMDAVRITVEQMEEAERGLLALRTQRAQAAQHSSTVVIALGSLLGVMFLTVAGATVSREIGVNARARVQVKALNTSLEQRVEQRTAALQSEVTARLESEGRLAAVIRSAMDSIITVDDQQRIVLFNQAAEKIFQCPLDEAMGRPITAFIPHMGVLDEGGFTNQAVSLQDALWAVRANGEKFQIEASISQIEIAGHQISTVILRDISERKETEVRLAAHAAEVARSRQALETQKLLLQSVLNSMVEGLVAADEQGNFILWNPAAEEILGLGPGNLSPADWSVHYGVFLPDMITPFPNEQNPLLLAITGKVTSAVMFIRNPSLERGAWIESNGAPLRGKDGLVRGGMIAFRDITRRKADELEIRTLNEDLEEKIARRTEQLEAANHELEAFSYSVSHDLRAPLRHIAGFSRILVKDFGPVMPVDARKHLQRIEDAVSRMGLLVDALLKMATLRRQSLRLSHNELNPIVDEVVSMLQSECDGREVEWHIAKLPALDCDPILLTQVFQNLLGNALKYTRGRAKAVIEVDSIQQPGKPAILFVRDNGAGFNMKFAERLFGVFQRFHSESEFEGSGVGLALVHRIIQKHGGTIWAEAEVDHGATFYFALEMTEQIRTIPKARAAS